MDHVTFWMPVLGSPVSGYFDELFENCLSTSMTPNSKTRRIMEMTIYLSIMFIVTIFWTEYGVAKGTSEMFDMIFFIQSGDVGSS